MPCSLFTLCLNCADEACDFSESGFLLLPVSCIKMSQVLREPTGSCGLSHANDTMACISSRLKDSLNV